MKNRIYKRDMPRFLAANANKGLLAVTFYDCREAVVIDRGRYAWIKRLLTRIAQWLVLEANEWAFNRLQANTAKAIRESFKQRDLKDWQIVHAVNAWARATRFYHKPPKLAPAIREVWGG